MRNRTSVDGEVRSKVDFHAAFTLGMLRATVEAVVGNADYMVFDGDHEFFVVFFGDVSLEQMDRLFDEVRERKPMGVGCHLCLVPPGVEHDALEAMWRLGGGEKMREVLMEACEAWRRG